MFQTRMNENLVVVSQRQCVADVFCFVFVFNVDLIKCVLLVMQFRCRSSGNTLPNFEKKQNSS